MRIAWRNVWRNGRRTVIAIAAMSLALTLIVVFDGMMGGMTGVMYENTVRYSGGHVLVHALGYREKANQLPLYPIPVVHADAAVEFAMTQPGVTAAAKRIQTAGLLSSREGSFPTVFIGIEPEREVGAALLSEQIVAGRYLTADDEDVILIGRGLADALEVDVDDRITLSGRATHEQMRQRTLTVVGIYEFGGDAMEKSSSYVSLAEAQTLFDLRDQVTEVGVYMSTMDDEVPVVNTLKAVLPGYEVDAWNTISPEMVDAMAVDEQMLDILSVVILLIAGVGIFNLMLMVVVERTREIGLIAAMGMKRQEIVALFLIEGSILGAVSGVAGSVLGGLLNLWGSRAGLPMPYDVESFDMAIIALMGDRIFFDNDMEILVTRSLTVVGVALVASLYPAWRASQREPAEALHYV
ncbi:MAG: FtsX-like permease family protein [Anaerolineae bacterium]|nr:FtsX-like permease family protein [Anaerolineae bacterium]